MENKRFEIKQALEGNYFCHNKTDDFGFRGMDWDFVNELKDILIKYGIKSIEPYGDRGGTKKIIINNGFISIDGFCFEGLYEKEHMQEIRCKKCDKLLGTYRPGSYLLAELKCPRCKSLNEINIRD